MTVSSVCPMGVKYVLQIKDTLLLVCYIYDEWAYELRMLGAEGVGGRSLLVHGHFLRTVSSWSWLLGSIWREITYLSEQY